MDGFSKRAFLRGSAAAGLAAVAGRGLAATMPAGLRDAAAAKGIAYGTAAGTYQFDDPAFAKVLPREAAVLVAEYEMKRDLIEHSRGMPDFSGADRMLAFAGAQDMAVRGHTLVWYAANPDWLPDVVTATRDEKLFTDYVRNVMGRYRGKVRSWDVVNEAVKPEDGRADGLRDCFWLKAFGPSYIDRAFQAARAADPEAQLVYNDWGCEGPAPENDAFRAATLKFLEGLRARRTPVDAFGMQGHLSAFGPPVDQAKLRAFLRDVEATGFKILITELDVDESGGSPDIDIRDRAVADATRRFLDAVLDNRATNAVLTWGLSDRFLHAGNFGTNPRKLPLDSGLQQKPMWRAMAGAFQAARPR